VLAALQTQNVIFTQFHNDLTKLLGETISSDNIQTTGQAASNKDTSLPISLTINVPDVAYNFTLSILTAYLEHHFAKAHSEIDCMLCLLLFRGYTTHNHIHFVSPKIFFFVVTLTIVLGVALTQRLNDENVVLSDENIISKTISHIQTTIEHVLNNLKPFFVCVKRGQFLHNVCAPFVTKVGVKVQQLFLTALATKLSDTTEFKIDPHRSHTLLLLFSRLYLDLKKVLSHIESHLTLLLSLADQHKFNDFGVYFNNTNNNNFNNHLYTSTPHSCRIHISHVCSPIVLY
jgi:hypothetical protein